ncbi:MAG: transposase [Puniceicoccales bacterium]|nr:transposase [Puniceicoccales bacterium]
MTIVYVDESGIDRHLHRRNARSAKGKKVFGFVAGKKFQRTNIAAGYADSSVSLQKGKHSLCG